MEVIPAIDIRGGRCVRLVQGDYDRETVFGEDPVEAGRQWEASGACRLHVVDLDGAREGRPVNEFAVRRIVAGVAMPVQLGGGLRDIETISEYLNAGVDRVVLGTAAIKDEPMLREAVSIFEDRIVVGVDARDGMVATHGWLETSEVGVEEFVRHLSELGVARIVYTDIARDGMLAGPNFTAVERLLAFASSLNRPLRVVSSGGVASIEDVRRLATTGVEAAIIGKALYTGDVDLQEAMEAAG